MKSTYCSTLFFLFFVSSLLLTINVNQDNVARGAGDLPQKCISVPTARAIDWSPDGDSLAVMFAEGIYIFNRDLEQEHYLEDILAAVFDGKFFVTDLKWHPKGQYLVTGGLGSWKVPRIWDVNKEVAIADLFGLGPSSRIRGFEFSPDGSQLAVAHDVNSSIIGTFWQITAFELPEQLSDLNFTSDVPRTYFPYTFAGINSIEWSPDGTRILSAKENGMIDIYDVEDPEFPRVYEGHRGPVNQAVWRGAESFYSVGEDRLVMVWFTDQSRYDDTVWSQDASITTIDVSDDYIATGDESGIIYVLSERHSTKVEDHLNEAILDLKISPDQSALASVSADGQVCIWDIENLDS